MTVDELIGVYIEASNAVVWEAEKRGLCPMTLDMQRAGVTAIVRALRDEMANDPEANRPWWWGDAIHAKFEAILGSEAGEKVGKRLNRAAARNEAMQLILDEQRKNQPLPPATDAAPAVCVWKQVERTPLMLAHWTAECTGHAMWSPDWARCPNCKAPIKFTGGNHG